MKLTITTNEYEILKVPFNADTVIIVHDFDISLLDEYKTLVRENEKLKDDVLSLALAYDDCRNP